MKTVWCALLLLPSLLLADVDPATTLSGKTLSAATPAPANHLATQAVTQLRLKPALSSPVVTTLPTASLKDSSQDAGIADGKHWMSVEKPVTLTGYVDKTAIDKDLSVEKGTTVWTTAQKTEQLTLVDNPEDVKVMDADTVQVTEPRVLYYATTDAPVAAAPTPISTPAPLVDDAPKAVTAPAAAPVLGTPVVSTGNSMSIEGVLKKGNPLFGEKLYLVDAHGAYIARIDPKSPLDLLSMEGYLDKAAIYVGTLSQKGNDLTLTVRSIRME